MPRMRPEVTHASGSERNLPAPQDSIPSTSPPHAADRATRRQRVGFRTNRSRCDRDRPRSWYVDLEPAAATGARSNLDCPAGSLDALPDADQPKAFAPRRLWNESHSVVRDTKNQLGVMTLKINRHQRRLAVLDGVLQHLLDDTEQAERQGNREAGRNIAVSEGD